MAVIYYCSSTMVVPIIFKTLFFIIFQRYFFFITTRFLRHLQSIFLLLFLLEYPSLRVLCLLWIGAESRPLRPPESAYVSWFRFLVPLGDYIKDPLYLYFRTLRIHQYTSNRRAYCTVLRHPNNFWYFYLFCLYKLLDDLYYNISF